MNISYSSLCINVPILLFTGQIWVYVMGRALLIIKSHSVSEVTSDLKRQYFAKKKEKENISILIYN